MSRLKFITTCAAVLLGVAGAHAVPACPSPVEVVQPDGSVVTVTLKGDEHFNWAVSDDGYTLLRDDSGYLVYAESRAGRLEPSALHYRDGNSSEASFLGIKPGLNFSASQIREASSPRKLSDAGFNTQIDGTFPSKGERKLLMLLLNYKDTSPRFAKEDFDMYMNGEKYAGIGSFRDYYLENSYGQLDITTTVTRWITLPYEKSHYGADGALAMIADALHIIDGEIDFTEFDNDGDGILDGLAVIHQGAGQEATGSSSDIWSHSSTIYGMEFDGIQVRRYTIQPELLGKDLTKMSTIGVMCHEFGHNLGAPDFYDTDYSLSGGEFPGTGVWDLMGSGAWNGEYGNRPAGINMWQKIQLGWVSPLTLGESVGVKGMKGATFVPEAYRFDCTLPGEYFVIENRRREGEFDCALPGEGLLVYHINESLVDGNLVSNTINNSFPQAVYTVCAGAMCDPDTDSYTYGTVSSDIAPFPGSASVTAFNDRTLPSTRSVSGRYTYKGLDNIVENIDGTVDFDFLSDEEPASPRNLTATSRRGIVSLSWDAPEGDDEPVCYNLFRNGHLLSRVEGTSYVDDAIGNQTLLSYTVDAEYQSGLVSPYIATDARIPSNRIVSLDHIVADNGSVKLSWELDTRLTRMNDDEENFEMIDLPVKSMDYVHRFRAEDLAIYKGYKIRRVAFYPCQSQNELKCTLRVWESEPGDGSPAQLVSERVLKEFGNMVWNNIVLTKSVEITADKDVWIGVHYESAVTNVTVLTDKGPAVKGYGDLVSYDGKTWTTDMRLNGNIFGYATLVKPAIEPDREIVVPAGETDAKLDMYYPYAFAVYRDGNLLGTTLAASFKDENPGEGIHQYSVSGLFKGDNESRGVDLEVDLGASGISDVAADAAQAVEIAGREVRLPGYRGYLVVVAVDGTLIYCGDYATGQTVTVAPGVYVFRTDNSTIKVLVK